jgi:hypothetical protein
MTRRRKGSVTIRALAWALAGVASWAGAAGAQTMGAAGSVAYGGMGTGASLGSGAPAGLYANPYMVPAMNPFLNPYASLYAPTSPQNAALYFFAAQQSMGGIGSGQLSGSRPRPGAQAQAASPIPADRRVSDTPGAGAARYFNRPVQGGASAPKGHYNRFGNHYSSNGH